MESEFLVWVAVKTARAKIAAEQALELLFGPSLIGVKNERKNIESTGYISQLRASVKGELPGDEDARALLSDLDAIRDTIEKDSVV